MDSLIHSWLQLATFLVALFVFVWYMRKDSKDDYIRLEKSLNESRKETNAMILTIHQEMVDFHNAMKDFHGRVCILEEKNKGK